MKQRVGLFIALIASDELILLDAGLQMVWIPNGINSLLTLIKSWLKPWSNLYYLKSYPV